eukprot:TRINITY_DN37604_c0_g1_i1.p2 TRINITY_DN37604_c0_g1~~TRINITY_DN37604_c0_g1_i1.p2  ORF type:complete len:105 (+),score=23.79 TRINITY_DN37604_c0_g1_i1:2-316(+)
MQVTAAPYTGGYTKPITRSKDAAEQVTGAYDNLSGSLSTLPQKASRSQASSVRNATLTSVLSPSMPMEIPAAATASLAAVASSGAQQENRARAMHEAAVVARAL